jgi:hypothetical protein
MSLTSLDAVKSYLKINISETTDDDLLSSLIEACSNVIENYCNRKFGIEEYEEEYDGVGKPFIILHNYPVNSIISVMIDGEIVEPIEYKIRKNNGMLFRKSGIWPHGIMNIKVTYSSGTDEIPAAIELACKHLVMSYFKSDIASFSTTFQDGVVFRPEALPSQVKALVSPYKKVM